MPKAAPPSLDSRALNRELLARQMLLAREAVPAAAVLARVVGLQAQWPRPPFVGVWTRSEDFRRAELLDLLAARAVVRGTLFRGTLHLVTAADYAAFRPALQPVLTRGLRLLGERGAGIDPGRATAAARRFLAGGPRTFEDIRDHLVATFPDCNDRGLGYTVRMLLPLVQEPSGGAWGFPSVSRFALADAWLGMPIAGSGAVEPLLLRYLAAFGPASVGDAQTWSGLQNLKPAFEALRPRLAVFRDARRRELFDLPDAPRPDAGTAAPVRFLPEFDNVLLAHQDRSRIVADAHKPAVYLPALRVAPTFLVDGCVAGTWAVETKQKVATLVATPFGGLAPSARKALRSEAEALVRFLEPEARDHAVSLAS